MGNRLFGTFLGIFMIALISWFEIESSISGLIGSLIVYLIMVIPLKVAIDMIIYGDVEL